MNVRKYTLFTVLMLFFATIAQASVVEQVKETVEEKAVELAILGETTVGPLKVELLENDDLKATLIEAKPLSLLDIPAINNIAMPDQIRSLIGKLKIDNLVITGAGKFINIAGTTKFLGDNVPIRLRIVNKPGKKLSPGWAFYLGLPQKVTLSKLSPLFKIADFGIINGYLIFSGINFTDPDWGGVVAPGTTLGGTVKIPVGATSYEVPLRGFLKKGWVGSRLVGTAAKKEFIISIGEIPKTKEKEVVIEVDKVRIYIGEAKVEFEEGSAQLLPDGTFKINIQKLGKVSLLDVPVINAIPIPDSVRSKLEKIFITNLRVYVEAGTVFVSGKANFYGSEVDTTVQVRKKKTGIGYDWAVKLEVPKRFELADLTSLLKPVNFAIENGYFVFSDTDFESIEWGGKVRRGTTFIGTIKARGTLKRLLAAVGSSLNEVTVKGTLTKDWVGSELDMAIPGQINFGKGVKTTGFILSLGIARTATGAPASSLGIKTGLLLELKDPFTITATIKAAPDAVKLVGTTEGAIRFPGVPLEIEDIKAEAKLTPGKPPGLGLGGIMNLGSKKLDLILYVAPPDLLAKGEFKGGLSLIDIVRLVEEVIKTATKKSISLVSKVQKAIPNIKLDNAKVYVAPKSVEFANIKFAQGILIDTQGVLFGKKIGFRSKVSPRGFSMRGFLERTKLGPLIISGYKTPKGAEVIFSLQRPTLLVTTGEEGEGLEPEEKETFGYGEEDVEKKPTEETLKAYVDASLELNLGSKVGKATAKTHIDLTPTSGIFDVKVDLFNKTFLVTIIGDINLANPLKSAGKFAFEQSAMDKLAGLLKQGSQKILDAREAVVKARKDATRALKEAERQAEEAIKKARGQATGELRKAKDKVEAAQAKLDSAIAVLDKAQSKILILKGDWDRVAREWEKCVGKR